MIVHWKYTQGSYQHRGYDTDGRLCAKVWSVGEEYRLAVYNPFEDSKDVGFFDSLENAMKYAEALYEAHT